MKYHDARVAFERTYWRQLLDSVGGRVAKAADAGGVSRPQLYKKLGQIGLFSTRSRLGGNAAWRELDR